MAARPSIQINSSIGGTGLDEFEIVYCVPVSQAQTGLREYILRLTHSPSAWRLILQPDGGRSAMPLTAYSPGMIWTAVLANSICFMEDWINKNQVILQAPAFKPITPVAADDEADSFGTVYDNGQV